MKIKKSIYLIILPSAQREDSKNISVFSVVALVLLTGKLLLQRGMAPYIMFHCDGKLHPEVLLRIFYKLLERTQKLENS